MSTLWGIFLWKSSSISSLNVLKLVASGSFLFYQISISLGLWFRIVVTKKQKNLLWQTSSLDWLFWISLVKGFIIVLIRQAFCGVLAERYLPWLKCIHISFLQWFFAISIFTIMVSNFVVLLNFVFFYFCPLLCGVEFVSLEH